MKIYNLLDQNNILLAFNKPDLQKVAKFISQSFKYIDSYFI